MWLNLVKDIGGSARCREREEGGEGGRGAGGATESTNKDYSLLSTDVMWTEDLPRRT